MKVIFLDIDGVLNSQDWYVERNKKGETSMDDYPLCEFDSKAIARLNRIMTETGASIVVSSTWRIGKTIEQLRTLLKDVGLKNPSKIIGKTISMKDRGKYGETVRGDEINQWLANTNEQIHSYLILDDDNDMCQEQRNNFIKTTWLHGLEDKHITEAIRILNKTECQN